MIALSSARRHEKNQEYAVNQKRAADSWNLFSTVYYFGSYEEDLCRDNVRYVKSDDWPTIKEIAIFASHMDKDELVALINADIVVTEPILEVDKKLKELTMPAATSYRYEFDPTKGLESAVRIKEDRGMDIFVAQPHIWKMVAARIPDYLRIGHQQFDSWLCGFFCANFGFGFRQFTDYKCIFHPKHNGRETPHSASIRSDDEYFTRAHVPSPL